MRHSQSDGEIQDPTTQAFYPDTSQDSVLLGTHPCGSQHRNHTIAERCGVSVLTISHWRRCWRERGVAGLHGEMRPGRPRSYDDEQVAELMRKVLHSRPPNATH